MTAFWAFVGAAVGVAAGLFSWLAWLDHRDELWIEYEWERVDGEDLMRFIREDPDFLDWELEIMSDD